MKLEICHLYPDLLSGDRGNILCMQKRLIWRGIEAGVTKINAGEEARLPEFDLIFLGGGQTVACEGGELRAAVEGGKVILAIDAGYELLGRVGALDLQIADAAERFTGNMMFDAGEDCGVVVGFENHGGRVTLGPRTAPLGKILIGRGNNGADGTEGCRYKNVFCTYAHGPVLPKNPKLADYILSTALSIKYPGAALDALDDSLENAAHGYMSARLRMRG